MATFDESHQGNTGSTIKTEQANNVRQYWHIVLERRWLIIATFSVCFVAAVFYALKATPMFTAKARLQIDPEASGVLNLKDTITVNNRDQDYLQTQYRNLENRSLIAEVVEKLKLKEEDARYKSAADPVGAVDNDISIVPVRLTRHVEVHVTHSDPNQAEKIANTLLQVFLRKNLDEKKAKALQGYNILYQEAQAKEIEIGQLQRDLEKYRKEKGMVSLRDDQNIDARSLAELKTAFETQRIANDAATKLAQQAAEWKSSGKDISEFGPVTKDEQVALLKSRINQTASQLAQLRTKYRERHPSVMAAVGAIQADTERLKQESDRAFNSLILQSEAEKTKESIAAEKYRDAEKRVFSLGDAKVEYGIMEQKLKRVELIYQAILTKAREFDLGSKDLLQNMKVVDQAIAPTRPVKPNKPLILIAGVIGGLSMALGLAFFVNYLDDAVKSQEDVENYLHLPFLGYIPNIKSTSVVERDLQAHLHPTSSTAEGFRTLRAAVSLARNAEKLRVVGVTSTIPSEGKSLVASNYAIVTAQTGLKTLLVDADLRRPSVHKAFQLQSPVGLSAYLAERVNNVSEIAHTTDVPNLDVICCGAVPANPSELISSKRMLQFLEEASTKYDRVVLDCPPVSAVADPLVVGAMADGVIFVTKFKKIRREHAQRSVQRIQDAGIHLIGLVLNDIDFEGKDSYYYSYHYYQNRYYASHYRNKSGDTGVTKKTEAASGKVSKS
jgi:polysaccharide biosynthesis transport protein